MLWTESESEGGPCGVYICKQGSFRYMRGSLVGDHVQTGVLAAETRAEGCGKRSWMAKSVMST